MSRADSPKRHYISSWGAKETACNLNLGRVTCTHCQKNMGKT